MSASVGLEMQEGIAVVTLNAPERRNAIGAEMRVLLLEKLKHCFWESDCRAIVLTGAGRHFCAGGDMKAVDERSGPNPALSRRNIAVLHEIVRLISSGPKPVVAAVDGDAFGAGLALASCCDSLLITETARFCASFARVGLLADSGLIWSLPRRIGYVLAKQLILTARVVGAAEAAAMKLADQIVPTDQLLAVAADQARQMSAHAPLAIAAVKSVMGRDPTSLEALLGAELDLQPLLTLSSDYEEGRAAFRERRPPRFRGR